MTSEWATGLQRLAERETSSWPAYLSKLGLQTESLLARPGANLFLLACSIDYQQPSGRAWDQAGRLPDRLATTDVLAAVVDMSEEAWMERKQDLGLHRFPAAHRRIHRIARRLQSSYDGDASKLWKGGDAPRVIKALRRLGLGDQLSPMAAGGLADLGIIDGHGPVKADIHVRRVLGRVASGDIVPVEEAIRLADRVYPGESWRLDQLLWRVGTNYCKPARPRCGDCPLREICAHAQEATA